MQGRSQESAVVRRVLVVDDQPDICALLVDVLAAEGYAVTTASNGAEALERLEESLPDLMLLDIRMPVMDGWEVLHQRQQQPAWRALPVVACSASYERDLQQAKALGATDYLAKPFDLNVLLDVVSRIAASV
jgi:CheY-like chemotaxis protein